MNLLLDTHALLWWLDDPAALADEAYRAIRQPENRVFVSAAVAWEIGIKHALGKLRCPDGLEEALAASGFQQLPVGIRHALAAAALPAHHADPFDRMLVAQARAEGMTLVTRDQQLHRYDVSILPA